MIPELMRKRENGKQSSSMIPELMQKREERETKEQYDLNSCEKERTGNKVAV